MLSWAYFLYENSDSDLQLMKASIHCAVRNAWIISCWKCVQCLTLTHGVTFNHFHFKKFVNGVYNLCLRVSAFMFHVNVVLLTYVWVFCLVPYVCFMRFTNHCLIYFSSSFQPTNLETTRDGRHSSESSYRLEDHWSNITREYLDILRTSHFGTVVWNILSLVFRFFECWNYVLYRMFNH